MKFKKYERKNPIMLHDMKVFSTIEDHMMNERKQ